MQGRKVLLIDDEPDVLDTLQSILSDEGYDVATAHGSQEALKLVDNIHFSKVPEGQKATSAGILIDKARLIDGESTENVLIANIESSERQLLKDMAAKMASTYLNDPDIIDVEVE